MKRLSIIFSAVILSISVWAVPARHRGVVRTSADGSEKIVYMHGDESFHYWADEEGRWLDEESMMPLSIERKTALEREGDARVQSRRVAKLTGVDRLLAPKGAVILVNFSDTQFTYTKEQMIEWATSENYTADGATGSICQYFREASFGQYNLQLDFYGPVTVSQPASYYGQNNASDNDMYPGKMVKEACQLAAEEGCDFSQYDYNNDGDVDWVVVVYAGKGEADSYIENTIWPHQYMLSYTGDAITLNGKRINRYCCTNEISYDNNRAGIAVFCHEFSHILGLPDLYTTNYSDYKTNGEWDIMDYGCYNNDGKTPPMYSAYERWWMGWMTPRLVNSDCNIALGELNSTQYAVYMTSSGSSIKNILEPNPSTFYVFEHREQRSWDAYLPGHGMLITKINWSYSNWVNNIINNNQNNMGVDIREADGLTPTYVQNNRGNGYFGKQGDTYPSGATTFTEVTNYPVTNIFEEDDYIKFRVGDGGDTIYLDITQQAISSRATKVLHNDHILILRDGKMYDVLGHELEN